MWLFPSSKGIWNYILQTIGQGREGMSFIAHVVYPGILKGSFPSKKGIPQHLDDTGLVSHVPVNKTLKHLQFLFMKLIV